MGHAIIIPEMTDLNRGDQALIWEATRLLKETEIISTISLLEEPFAGNFPNPQSLQSKKVVEGALEVVLKHPARGAHTTTDIRYSLRNKLLMGARGVCDLVRMRRLLQNIMENKCKNISKILTISERKTVAAFAGARIIVVKGGGAFHAFSSNAYWEYYLWYNTFHIILALALKKRVIVLPNSFGPFPGLRNKRVVRNAFSKVGWIAARESISAETLSKVICRDVSVKPDLGFYLKPRYSLRVNKILQEWTGSEVIIITLRPWRFPENGNPDNAYRNYILSIVELINWAHSEGLRPIVVAHCLGPSAHEDDRYAIRTLSQFIEEKDVEIVDTEDMDCEEVAALYGAAFITVGTRFHSVIFSLAQGIPSIAIGYGGNKAKGILKDIGLENWHLPIEHAEGRSVVRMSQNLLTSMHQVKITLRNLQDNLENDRRTMKEEIIRVLEE